LLASVKEGEPAGHSSPTLTPPSTPPKNKIQHQAARQLEAEESEDHTTERGTLGHAAGKILEQVGPVVQQARDKQVRALPCLGFVCVCVCVCVCACLFVLGGKLGVCGSRGEEGWMHALIRGGTRVGGWVDDAKTKITTSTKLHAHTPQKPKSLKPGQNPGGGAAGRARRADPGGDQRVLRGGGMAPHALRAPALRGDHHLCPRRGRLLPPGVRGLPGYAPGRLPW